MQDRRFTDRKKHTFIFISSFMSIIPLTRINTDSLTKSSQQEQFLFLREFACKLHVRSLPSYRLPTAFQRILVHCFFSLVLSSSRSSIITPKPFLSIVVHNSFCIMKPIAMMSRNTGSFMNWLSSTGGRPVLNTQPASTSSRTAKGKPAIEILPGVTLENLPTKPLRPPSAYNLYVKEKLVGGSGIPAAAQMRQISIEWKSVPAAEKARYESQVRPAMEKYKQQMNEYSRFMSQKLTITQVAQILKTVTPKSRGSTRKLSGYNLFLREATKGTSGKPDVKAIASQWSSLSTSDKLKWNDRAVKTL